MYIMVIYNYIEMPKWLRIKCYINDIQKQQIIIFTFTVQTLVKNINLNSFFNNTQRLSSDH